MKKHLVYLLLTLVSLFATQAYAQSYNQLWHDAEKNFNNDLPKSALASVQAVRDRALAEKNMPQLLRALCTEYTIAGTVSSDSTDLVVNRIEEALAGATAPAERALWHYALGRLTNSGTHIRAAISDPEILAETDAQKYVPALVIGRDSRVFDDDLLSVVAMEVLNTHILSSNDKSALVDTMCHIYNRRGNMAAVATLKFLKKTKWYFSSDEDTELIADLRAALPAVRKAEKKGKGNIAVNMLAWIEEKECPSVSTTWLSEHDNIFYPADVARLAISSRNCKTMQLNIYHVGNRDNTCPIEEESMASIVKSAGTQLVASHRKELQHTPANTFFRDTLAITLPATGIYISELRVDGEAKQYATLHVNDLTPVIFRAHSVEGNHQKLSLVDARTGRPVTEGVTAQRRREMRTRGSASTFTPWTEAEVDSEGNINLDDFGSYDQLAFKVGDNAFYPILEPGGYSSYKFGYSDILEESVRLFTDRAIYRPGQQVMVGGLVMTRRNDDYKAVNGLQGQLVLQNTKREDIASLDVMTDEWGQFDGQFTLPEHVVPGRFAIVFRDGSMRSTEYINVEEYKRPTFRVNLTAPSSREVLGKDRWEVGDTLTLQGRVESYSGVAVPDATVEWAVSFRDWEWLRYDDRSHDHSYRHSGTATSDSYGRFTITVALQHEGSYSTEVDVHAPNGESGKASHYISVGRPAPKPVSNKTNGQTKHKLFEEKLTHRADAAALTIHFGALDNTERPHYVFYKLTSSLGGIIDTKTYTVTDDSVSFDLKWKEEYGEGATAYVGFVKDATLHSASFSVKKPLPRKDFIMEWSTFRDLLQPGQKETWTLSVKRPDGTPADAVVMARMYDASLDAFVASPWSFGLQFTRRLPDLSFRASRFRNFGMNYEQKRSMQSRSWDFTHVEPTMFNYYTRMYKTYMAKSAPRATDGLAMRDIATFDEEAADIIGGLNMVEPTISEGNASKKEVSTDVPLRTNFNETAFFMPCLHTDTAGHVTISFTLPESLTEWKFTALAHDKEMNYGLLNDTIHAQKKLMTEIAAPRFLRAGDKTEMPVTVRNLCDAPMTGEVTFTIVDAATHKTLKTEKRAFSLAALGQSITATGAKTGKTSSATFRFAFEADRDVNVRAVACGTTVPDKDQTKESYSDGEERNVPFIDGRELVQVSVPFSATAKGTIKVDLAPLHLAELTKKDAACRPQLSVEYSANPLWNVVRVVPSLFEGEAFDATDWATRLYAIEVANFLATRLKDTASAALIDSVLAKKDIPALRYAALDHLRDFQRGDGGFCWIKGFDSSTWMTTDVGIILARQQKMTGSRTANSMLEKAMSFLESKMEEHVKLMKKNKDKDIDELSLRYLYLRQLLGLQPDKTAKYLLDLAAKEKKNLTMYGKGVAAQILHGNHNDDALLALQSLVEFTVATPEMGRYFDTNRAFGAWASYKIPTQTMAIEALGSAAKTYGTKPIFSAYDACPTTADSVQQQMKLWLLQSKRTQKWESSRATADATYALLHGDCDPEAPSQLFQALAPEDYSKHQLAPADNQHAINSASYNIKKESDGLSWGAVYADYSLPVEMVEASSAGFTLTRSWEVWRNNKWQPISAAPKKGSSTTGEATKTAGVKVGERVRQTLTITAERDYDFVLVEASRAACLETTQPLSGMAWMGGTACYRMVRDTQNDYYFEHLAKGTHSFSEELIVDRTGTFSTGVARVRSTFAPEFSAYAPSYTIFATFK